MMWKPVTKDDVEPLRLERQPEQISLNEPHSFQMVLGSEILSQAKRIRAAIDSDHSAAGNTEEIAQLTRPTANFQYRGVVRDRLVKRARVRVLLSLLD